MNSELPPQPGSGRLESLDALRGFDMFWIVGGAAVVHALARGTDRPWLLALDQQLRHPEWEGFRAFDLIMPLFLFLIGVAMPLAFAKRLARGQSRWQIFRHVLVRVAVLCFLGMLVNGNLLTYDPHRFQLTYSVLHVLAMGYLVAAVLLLNLKPRGQIVATVVMLLAYWVVQTYVPAPGRAVGSYPPGATFGDWLNERLLGSWQGEWRRPWIVSMTTYGATAMLGALAGQWLQATASQRAKVLGLVAAGLGCLAAGWAWSLQMPIIKKVWTSSYALYAGGWSYLLLALFYLLIDVWGLRRWALPFTVIGTNAISAYMMWNLFSPALRQIAGVFLGGLRQYTGPGWYAPLEAAGAALGLWLLLYQMYRTRTFVKI
jgi:predicted acyltransferase